MKTNRRLAGIYELDPNHSSVGFAVGHMSLSTFRASFGDVQVRLVADDEGVALEGRTRTESVSITAPPEFREHVVHGRDFFDAGAHPELTFRSSEIELREDGGAKVRGRLALRGVGRDITLEGRYRGPIDDPYGAERVAFELRTTVDRRAWNLDWQMQLPDGQDALGWDVELNADLELVKAA